MSDNTYVFYTASRAILDRNPQYKYQFPRHRLVWNNGRNCPDNPHHIHRLHRLVIVKLQYEPGQYFL